MIAVLPPRLQQDEDRIPGPHVCCSSDSALIGSRSIGMPGYATVPRHPMSWIISFYLALRGGDRRNSSPGSPGSPATPASSSSSVLSQDSPGHNVFEAESEMSIVGKSKRETNMRRKCTMGRRGHPPRMCADKLMGGTHDVFQGWSRSSSTEYYSVHLLPTAQCTPLGV